ncbi:MAG: hypothetical protein KAT90_15540, partial [Gammaproteobacteria bacterium]|nr:hypothetical protein [Gammaproteobacteria bacterium]
VNWAGIHSSRAKIMEKSKMIGWKELLLFLCIFIPAQVVAQQYSEQSLKTLFTSQQERQDIERGRKGNNSSGDQGLVGPSSVQINGMVKRSNGKSVVWVNGKSTLDNSMVDGVKVYSKSIKANNKIPVMIDGQKVYIKPGETWSEETGVSDVGD